MYELALFAGAGGGLLASQWLKGWRTVCYVEWAEYPARIIEARIRDGLLDDAPIWDDVATFDGRPWRGFVDIVSAGFPCQPFAAGGKRRGADDSRNGWPATIRIIGEVRPSWVFLENSPNLLSPFRKYKKPSYFNTVLRDLASIGYDARWGCLSAATFGADHKRRRLWVVAYPGGEGRKGILRCRVDGCIKAHRGNQKPSKIGNPDALDAILNRITQMEERLGESSVFRNDDGLPNRVDRLAAIGNGQVPIVAATAWDLLTRQGRGH